MSLLASLNHGFRSNSEDACLLEPLSCHNALLFLRVSLGRVQEEQVEKRSVDRDAPIATMTTRAP
jgi:hypothetical protein